MKKKIPYIILAAVLIAVFIFMFVLNHYTAFVADDYIYQYVFENRFPTASTRLLSNPLELFGSMANHWRLWGGRVTVHFFLQFAFLLGRDFFDVFNSIMFIVLGILIYLHVCGKKSLNIPLLITIFATVFLFVPQPGSTILWKSGSANYLWSSVLIMVMTLIFKKHLDDKNAIKDNNRNRILLLLYGLLIGCANENSGCALIVAIIMFTVFYKIKYNNIPKWCYFALAGTVISYILLVVAPGNYIRTEEMYPGVNYGIPYLVEYTIKITRLTKEHIGTIVTVAIFTFILSIKKQKDLKAYISEYGVQIIFLCFSFISVYSLVLSPAYPERCWMFAFVYLVIIIGLNLSKIEEGKYAVLIKKLYIFLMICLSFNAISAYNEAYYDIKDTKACIDDHAEQIREQLKNGKMDVSVHSFPESVGKYNSFTYNGYLTFNPESWTNRWIAEYYGASSIVADG